MSDEKVEDSARGKVDLKRLLKLAGPEWKALTMGTFVLVIGSGTALAAPQLLDPIIEGLSSGGGREQVTKPVLQLLFLMVIGAIAGGLRAWLFTVAGERIVTDLRKRLYASIIGQEIAFFDERRTGELTNRLASDTTVIQNTVSVNISMLLRFVALAIGAVFFLFITSWRLALATLLVIPVIAIGAGVVGRRLRGLARDVQDALADATTVAEETVAGIRTVRAFAQEPGEVARYGEAVERSFTLARKRAAVIALFRGGMSVGMVAALALVLLYGGWLVADGLMEGSELAKYGGYTMMAAVSLGALSGLYEDFMKSLGASERVFELIDRVPTVVSGESTPTAVRGHVEFQNVDFAYPTRPEHPVLKGLSLEMVPGEVVALVGPSGGGKSTIATLISRFYDPQAGQILLDEHPIKSLDKDWLRRQVGVVSQEPTLFATSILENITYGVPGATVEQAEAAAKAANAHEFISEFPEGYKTLVGERGVKLSGGQKQRVAIARALLRDPKILVLDEATSALDAESEHLVQEALDHLMKGRTTLVIAHRLSTVKEADRVLVLNNGAVVQSGTHDALVKVEGLYRRLVERQFEAA